MAIGGSHVLAQQAFREWKVEVGCAQCSYNEHHFALQLDHITPVKRKYCHSVYSFKLLERIKADPNIQVLCHRCHSIKTRKAGDYKCRVNKELKNLQYPPGKHTSYRTSLRKRRAIGTYLDGVRLARGCKKCGYADHHAGLHFDHIVPVRRKNGEKRSYFHDGVTTMTKAYEMANGPNIQILCCNCHSIKTWENKDYLPISEEIS